MKLNNLLGLNKDLEYLPLKIQHHMVVEKNCLKHLKIDLYNYILMI